MTEYDTRSVPESENMGFCHLPTSRGSPIIIVVKYSLLTPQKGSYPKQAFLEIFEKTKFRKNGPRMQLDPPGCYPDHLEWIYINQQLDIYIFMYIKKKFLSEGPLGVQILKNLSQRGVKTGINYPHTRLTTCLRVTKIPVWPTIVAENKDFLSNTTSHQGGHFFVPQSSLMRHDWLLIDQLRGRNDKSLCFHPLEHFLYHIQSFKSGYSTFSYTFVTLWSLNFSERPKMIPRIPHLPGKIRQFWVNRTEFSNSVKRG